MAIFNDIIQIGNDLANSEPQYKAKKIRIYSSGVIRKLVNAEYALKQIENLPNFPTQSTSTTGDINTSDETKLYFYVDSFFAFLYSCYDVIAQVINQKKNLDFDEEDVTFFKIKGKLVKNHLGLSLTTFLEKIVKKRYFINLRKYRHCSTHRRQIFIKESSERIPSEYGSSDEITVAGTYEITTRTLCDNPYELNPKIKQEREVKRYSNWILKNAKIDILKIMEEI